jgi:tRNA(fMet)-specific endonuclease VapC
VALLIDTDLLIDAERGVGTAAVETVLGDEERAISVITVSELLHGVHRATGARRARRSAFVEHLLAGIRAIPITEPVARVHAEVWAQQAARGQVIGAHDLWIAATALAHGLGVGTRNAADFERVPGLRVVGISSAGPS